MRPRTAKFLLWEAATLVGVFFLPSFVVFGVAPWHVGRAHFDALVLLGGAQLATTAVLAFSRRKGEPRAIEALRVSGLGLGAASLVIVMVGMEPVSRLMLGVAALVLLGGNVLLTLFMRVSAVYSLVVQGSVAIVVAVGVAVGPLPVRAAEEVHSASIVREVERTTHLDLELLYHEHVFKDSSRFGGGVDCLGTGCWLVRGDGSLYRLEWAADTLRPIQLPLRVPLNLESFERETPDDVVREWFRVQDLLLLPSREGAGHMLVSYHHWDSAERCYVMRLAIVPLDGIERRQTATAESWKTLYDTSPCLPILADGDRGALFAGLQSGGRLARFDAGRVLWTIGDHGFDGWNAREALPQDPDADYGKILLVDVAGKTARIFSSGHRNPQGLYMEENGRIWSTEHGPKGGDELNLIEGGANYGWPYVTLGTAYGRPYWPLENPHPAARFRKPVYAWLPSIGVSSLLAVRNSALAPWRGDLLVSALEARTVWRVRVVDGSVVFAERIRIGRRIRDLVETGRGEILLYTDRGTLVTMRRASLSRGEELFGQCVGCHGDSGTRGWAPTLRNVVRRRIASVPGYPYSEALSRLKGTWFVSRLDSFLADPAAFAPGNKMQFGRIEDPEDREALIRFLATLR